MHARLDGQDAAPTLFMACSTLIRDFNVEVQDGEIQLHPGAYLHNCSSLSAVNSDFYAEHMERAPLFLRQEAGELPASLAVLSLPLAKRQDEQ